MASSSSESFPEDAIQAPETSEPQDFPVNTTRGWRTLNGKCILVYNFKQSLNIIDEFNLHRSFKYTFFPIFHQQMYSEERKLILLEKIDSPMTKKD